MVQYMYVTLSHLRSKALSMLQVIRSCNTSTSALPDMYTISEASVDISHNAQVPVLHLICDTFGTLKISPNHLATALPFYIERDTLCDNGILFQCCQDIYIVIVLVMRKYYFIILKNMLNCLPINHCSEIEIKQWIQLI